MEILLATGFRHYRQAISKFMEEMELGTCTNAILEPGKIFYYVKELKPGLVIIDREYFEAINNKFNLQEVSNTYFMVVVDGTNGEWFKGGKINRVLDVIMDSYREEDLKNRVLFNLRRLQEPVNAPGNGEIETYNKMCLNAAAGSLVHDLKNVLTMLSGNSSLARLYLENGKWEKLKFKLKNIEEASFQAEELVQDVLQYTRINKVEADLKKIVDETAEIMFGDSEVELCYDLPKSLRRVNVDVNAIKQVINNLLLNALQAMEKKGKIIIKAENYGLTDTDKDKHKNNSLEPGNYVKLSIIDNGKGISHELLDRIFESHFSTKEKGSGLGLFSSYHIVKKHGGEIEVESLQGQGTSFHVYLPALTQPRQGRVSAGEVFS